MKKSTLIKIAYLNILKNKTRSLLTALGIIIGVFSVVIMVGIGEGTEQDIKKEISNLGTNLIFISPGSKWVSGINRGAGSEMRLTLKDVDKLKKESPYIDAISPLVAINSQVISGRKNWFSIVNGVSSDYTKIKDLTLADGVFFTEQDVQNRRNYCIIGQTINKELFSNNEALGKNIRIGQFPFRVIGVLESKGSSFGMDQDDVIYVPFTTVYYKMTNSTRIRAIHISVTSFDNLSEAEEDFKNILRQSHNIKEGASDDFTIGSQAEIFKTASNITTMITLLLGTIASISLLVGGIGIMNIMLVSVTERTKEIGLRMAIGARNKDVLLQFLMEAMTLSITGGLVGLILSFLAAILLTQFTTIPVAITPKTIIAAFLFSNLIGVFFGWYPAKKASNLNPIEALRFE